MGVACIVGGVLALAGAVAGFGLGGRGGAQGRLRGRNRGALGLEIKARGFEFDGDIGEAQKYAEANKPWPINEECKM